MIGLTRERTSAAVPATFHGDGRLKLERELLRRKRAGQKPRAAVWKEAKPQLREESGGKCGYCEGKADHVAHGDVEHYRPKDVYWWLAYCYDNYVYSCQICNQSYKGVNFPATGTPLAEPVLPPDPSDDDLEALAGTLGPDPLDDDAVQAHLASSSAEEPGIPDPYAQDPEALFAWKADSVLREVELFPRDDSPAATAAFAAATTYLGLNREELRRWRFTVYRIARALSASLAQVQGEVREATIETLEEMMSAHGEFAAMVRYFMNVEWEVEL